MKIVTNFVSPVINLVPWLRLALYAIAFIALTTALLFLVEAIQIQQQLAPLERHYQKLQKQVVARKTTKSPLPPVEKMNRTVSEVRVMNNLSGGKGWPLAKMLHRLEQMLPDSVYLTSLKHRQVAGEVQMVAVSRRASALTDFLRRLEQEPHFLDVLLVRQTQKRRGGRLLIHYELRFKERAERT